MSAVSVKGSPDINPLLYFENRRPFNVYDDIVRYSDIVFYQCGLLQNIKMVLLGSKCIALNVIPIQTINIFYCRSLTF